MISPQLHRRESVPYLPLRGMSLAPATRTAYSKQLGGFLSHARLDTRSFLVARASEIDRALAVYVQACYDARSSFNYVSQALSGAVHQRPDLRRSPVSASADGTRLERRPPTRR